VLSQLTAFLAISVVVIVTPGQDTALTIRNTLLGGRRGGISTALGVAVGQSCWTLAASAGVAALLSASEPAFTALKLAGAAYLVFLGLQSLRRSFRPRPPGPGAEVKKPALRPATAFRQGLVSNLGNPKMAIFFTSLLPQFAGRDASFATLFGLGLLFCAITLSWLTAYAAAVARADRLLRRPGVERALEAVTGFVLVGLGLRLAIQHR
jgi:threonine/homoserine/homoserine lactone efflux protein